MSSVEWDLSPDEPPKLRETLEAEKKRLMAGGQKSSAARSRCGA